MQDGAKHVATCTVAAWHVLSSHCQLNAFVTIHLSSRPSIVWLSASTYLSPFTASLLDLLSISGFLCSRSFWFLELLTPKTLPFILLFSVQSLLPFKKVYKWYFIHGAFSKTPGAVGLSLESSLEIDRPFQVSLWPLFFTWSLSCLYTDWGLPIELYTGDDGSVS